jgi:hypothetical protein
MRRSLIISTLLAASVVVLGACDPKPQEPVKPVSTPVPVATTAMPSPSPTGSPTGTPGKPGSTPEIKKTDGKNVNNDVKPASTQTPKGK